MIAFAAALAATVLSLESAHMNRAENLMRALDFKDSSDFVEISKAGYALGFVHGIEVTLEATKGICPGGGLSTPQIGAVVSKFIHERPKECNEDSAFMAMRAMYDAWPCKKS